MPGGPTRRPSRGIATLASPDERLRDWAVWFKENKDRGRDYDTEREFVHKTLEGLIECLLILRAEQRRGASSDTVVIPRLVGRL
jgi:hypothetical protein